MRPISVLIWLAGLLLLSACLPSATADSGATGGPSPPTASTALQPTASAMETALPSAQELIRLSKDHLSQRLAIPADEITLVEVTAVTWKDASLGCPRPGIDYIRIETPGYSIVFEAGGALYIYHTDQTRRVLPCGSRASGAASPTP